VEAALHDAEATSSKPALLFCQAFYVTRIELSQLHEDFSRNQKKEVLSL